MEGNESQESDLPQIEISRVNFEDIKEDYRKTSEALVKAHQTVRLAHVGEAKTIIAAKSEGENTYIGFLNINEDKKGVGTIFYRVHPAYQGKGIASALVKNAIQIAKEVDITSLQATVEKGSASEKVLQKSGFTLVSSEERQGTTINLYQQKTER